ncbi:MAG: site-2 protease family protein [Candidatus Competibacterales bacterium]
MFESSGYRIFTLAGVPVALSGSFFLLMGLLLILIGPQQGLPWLAAIFVSILIHEFGHAVVAKYYQLNPAIILHGFGGLCFHGVAKSDRHDALIVAAGPLVQIAAGLLVSWGLQAAARPSSVVVGVLIDNPWLYAFLVNFIWVSWFWGAINLLLPVWPLDGGQLTHLLLRRFLTESVAQRWALRVSISAIIVCALFALQMGLVFSLFILGMLFLSNVQALQLGMPLIARGGRQVAPKLSPTSKALFDQAETAYAEGDWHRAARLCHQLRADVKAMPPKAMGRLWEILGVATVQLEEWEEALSYLRRAPQTEAVREAIGRCEAALPQVETKPF